MLSRICRVRGYAALSVIMVWMSCYRSHLIAFPRLADQPALTGTMTLRFTAGHVMWAGGRVGLEVGRHRR